MKTRHRRFGVLVTIAVLASSVAAVLLGSAAGAATCATWSGTGSLQTLVTADTCVQVAEGTYRLAQPVRVPGGHTLRGDPSINAADTVLAPAAGWTTGAGNAVIENAGGTTNPATIEYLTANADRTATYGICCGYYDAEHVIVENARCSGAGIAGPDVTINFAVVRGNGFVCGNAPPGAGIYAIRQHATPDNFKPTITNSQIVNNGGPGLDIAGVWGGELIDNTITGNSSWAGVSLFGSNWTIIGNTIFQPASNQGQPYQPICRGGPKGVHDAAIFLCETTDTDNRVTVQNVISNNRVASWYGILLIGNDEAAPYLAPRNNTLSNNNTQGSNFSAADDFKPGQWSTDQNHWTGNTPVYF